MIGSIVTMYASDLTDALELGEVDPVDGRVTLRTPSTREPRLCIYGNDVELTALAERIIALRDAHRDRTGRVAS